MRFNPAVTSSSIVKLDAKGTKIIQLLTENARMPCTQIAKKVMLSKDAVKYRIRNYEKQGLIQGYMTVVDLNKLGFSKHHLFIQLGQVNNEARKQFIDALKSYDFVRVIIEHSGRYDLEVGVIAKDIDELDSIYCRILGEASASLKDCQLLILSRDYVSKFYPESFIELPAEKKKSAEESSFDKKDVDLLNIMADDAQLPLYEIGNRLGLSADAVNYRIKKLMASGIIRRFIPAINLSALGYTIHTVIMNLRFPDEKKLKYFLNSSKHIFWAVRTIGKYNLLMYICVRDAKELHDTIMALRERFEIQDYETLVAYEEHKWTYWGKTKPLNTC